MKCHSCQCCQKHSSRVVLIPELQTWGLASELHLGMLVGFCMPHQRKPLGQLACQGAVCFEAHVEGLPRLLPTRKDLLPHSSLFSQPLLPCPYPRPAFPVGNTWPLGGRISNISHIIATTVVGIKLRTLPMQLEPVHQGLTSESPSFTGYEKQLHAN